MNRGMGLKAAMDLLFDQNATSHVVVKKPRLAKKYQHFLIESIKYDVKATTQQREEKVLPEGDYFYLTWLATWNKKLLYL